MGTLLVAALLVLACRAFAAGAPVTTVPVVCDGTTDNTATVQSAIDAAETLGAALTSPGRIDIVCARGKAGWVSGPLLILGRIVIDCLNPSTTVMVLKRGATAPAITVLTAGAGPPAGAAGGGIEIDRCSITSADGKGANRTAHGLAMHQGSWTAVVFLNEDNVYEMPADGLETAPFACAGAVTGTPRRGSAVVDDVSSVAPLSVGCKLAGPGIPAGATITAIEGAHRIRIAPEATASPGSVTLTPSGKTNWTGSINGYGDIFYNNGGDGWNCNGETDMTFNTTAFAVNTDAGVALSGCYNVNLDAPGIFSNGRDGMYLYGENAYAVHGGSIDHNEQNGVYITNLSQGTGGGSSGQFFGTAFGHNGLAKAGRWNDIRAASGTGQFELIAPRFAAPLGNDVANIAIVSRTVTAHVTAPTCGTGGRASCVVSSAGYVDWGSPILTTERGTAYTLTIRDCLSTIRFTSPSPVTVTLPASMPPPCRVEIEQAGRGPVAFSPARGAVLASAQDHTRTRTRYSVVDLMVAANDGGAAAVWTLTGDGS
jgi:hypothetical protein